MLLRRLLSVSGRLGLRRSLSTAVSRPPWIMVEQSSVAPATDSVPRAYVRVVEPPRVSGFCIPTNLVTTGPGPDSDATRFLIGRVCSASTDGLLFLLVSVYDARLTGPILATQGASQVRQATGFDRGHILHTARFVCNALTGQLSRLPDLDMDEPTELVSGPRMGLLTQADHGHEPPNRFAVAELKRNMMLRFLSETGEWDIAVTAPYQLPLARPFYTARGIWDQEAFAFGGRLWWVDLTWGAISADPFSDRPESQLGELPTGSVLPAYTFLEIAQRELGRYRRMGVSEGRLRYAELSEREPFVLSVFTLDEEVSGWTLEHRVVLSGLWADGGDPSLHLPEKTTPQIGALDPLNANVIYLAVGRHVLGVDMNREEVIGSGSSLHKSSSYCVPCVLPPWLGSSRIPPLGMNGVVRNKTLAVVLVRSDRHQKT